MSFSYLCINPIVCGAVLDLELSWELYGCTAWQKHFLSPLSQAQNQSKQQTITLTDTTNIYKWHIEDKIVPALQTIICHYDAI